MVRTSILLIAALMGLCSPAASATLPATPADALAVIARAEAGDVVRLAPGAYGPWRLRVGGIPPGVTIDATAPGVRLTAVEIREPARLTVRGGTWSPGCAASPCFAYAIRIYGGEQVAVTGARFEGVEESRPGQPSAAADGYGLGLFGTRQARVEGGLFSGFKVGVVIFDAADFAVVGSRFSRMRSDGINVGPGSRRGLIEGNVCDATRITDDEHPDCIQAYSRPTHPPVADLAIRRNRALGDMQGVFLGNHVRGGVDDGGFDRITIEANDLTLAYPQGIAATSVRGLTLRDNRVRTLPGARWIASLNVTASTDVVRCGNVVEPALGRRGLAEPAC